MKKHMWRWGWIIFISAILSYGLTFAAFAAGQSMADADSAGIYSGGDFAGAAVKSYLDLITKEFTSFQDDIAGMSLGTMLVGIADIFYLAFAAFGVSLNSIIYGRVGGALVGMDNVNMFSFEMVQGNFYGIAAMAFYSVIRNAFFIIMLCIFMWDLVAFIYTNGDSRARARLKERVSSFVIMFLLLLIMPRLLDILLYLRDSLLYSILQASGTITSSFENSMFSVADKVMHSIRDGHNSFMELVVPGGRADICYTFRVHAINVLGLGASLGNCILYFASVFALFHFMAQYIGIALSMCVLVVFFPFGCLMDMVYPGVLREWAKNIVSMAMVPVIDAVLFCFPVLACIANTKEQYGLMMFVQLALIYAITPARAVVRSILGLGNGTAIEMSGFGAMMASMNFAKNLGNLAMRAAVGAATGGVGGAAMGAAGGVLGGKDNAEALASMFMARANRADMSSQEQSTGALDDIQKAMGGIPGTDDDMRRRRQQLESINSGVGTAGQKSRKRRGVVEDSLRDIGEKKQELEEKLADNEQMIGRAKKDLAASKDRQAALESRLAKIPSQPESPDQLHERDELKERIAQEKMNQTRLSRSIAEGQANDVEGKKQLRQLGNAERRGQAAVASMKASSQALGEAEDSDVMDQFADVYNFDSSEMRGISYERRAELTRERAAMQRRANYGRTVGGTLGGFVGKTAGLFYGPGASSALGSMGVDFGSQIGEIAGTVGLGGSSAGGGYQMGGGFQASGGYQSGDRPGQPIGPSGYDAGQSGYGGPPGTGGPYGTPGMAGYSAAGSEWAAESEERVKQTINQTIEQVQGAARIENNYEQITTMGPDGPSGTAFVPKGDVEYEELITVGIDGASGGRTYVPKRSGSGESREAEYRTETQEVNVSVQQNVTERASGTGGYGEGASGTSGASPSKVGGTDWGGQNGIYVDFNRDFASVFDNPQTQDALWDSTQRAFGPAAFSAQEVLDRANKGTGDRAIREAVIAQAVDAYTDQLGSDILRIFPSGYASTPETRAGFKAYMKDFVLRTGLASQVENDIIRKHIIEDDGTRMFS